MRLEAAGGTNGRITKVPRKDAGGLQTFDIDTIFSPRR
jgi:hypothetical protein